MNRKAKRPLDPKVFLSKVNGGRGKRRGTVSYSGSPPARSCIFASMSQKRCQSFGTVASEARHQNQGGP
jgi:hypothetical protein